MCDPTLSSEGSACTHYNSVDGIDNTWCPTLNGDVCGECNYCYRDGACDLTISSESYCLSFVGLNPQWCGSTTTSPPSPWAGSSDCKDSTGQLCTTCLTSWGCDSTHNTASDCNGMGQGYQWCGATSGTGDVCDSCNYCYLGDVGYCDSTYTDSVSCLVADTGGLGYQWCGGDACSGCNYCYRDGFCDPTLTDSASCTSHSSTTGTGLGTWCGATGGTPGMPTPWPTAATPRPTPAPTPATSDAVEGSFTCAGITLADAEAHAYVYAEGIAEIYNVDPYKVIVTFAAYRRRLQSSGDVVVSYAVLYASAAAATAAATAASSHTASTYQSAVQSAASGRGIALFASTTVQAVTTPTATVTTPPPSPLPPSSSGGGGGGGGSGGLVVIAIAVVVAVVLILVAAGAAYYYKTKKKDKGTKVVPAAKPEEAPVQPVRQPATQPATLPATLPAPASATAGAGPAAAYSQLTPETVKALRDAKKALDEGKMSEEDFKAMKAGLLGKQTPAAEAPTQQQTMTITVPPGAGPGTTLRVMTPSGQPMDIVVPPGAGPGTQLQVPVPVR